MTNKVLLNEAIARKGLKKKYLAEKLGISQACFINKINSDSAFRQQEISILKRELRLTSRETEEIFLS